MLPDADKRRSVGERSWEAEHNGAGATDSRRDLLTSLIFSLVHAIARLRSPSTHP